MKQLLGIFILLFIVSCAGIPTDALNSYNNSFESFNKASDDFLVQFGQTTKLIEKRKAEQLAKQQIAYQPYPKTIPTYIERSEVDPNVAMMRKALQVISTYNSTLTALSEGKSIKAVGNSASGLVLALNGLAGVTFPVNIGGLVSTIAQELEHARLRAEFRKALDTGVPIIREMFKIIQDNIDTHYDSNLLFANEARSLVVKEIIDRVTALQKLVANHKEPDPTSFKGLQKWQKELDSIFISVSKENVLRDHYPYPLSSNHSGNIWDNVVEASVASSLDHLKQLVERYNADVTRMNALAKSLSTYKQMLGSTNSTLLALVKAEKVPTEILKQAEYILDLAFQVKQHLAEIRSAEAAAK